MGIAPTKNARKLHSTWMAFLVCLSALTSNSAIATWRNVPPPIAKMQPIPRLLKSKSKMSNPPKSVERPKTKLTSNATNGFIPH